jgi:hypothetical protein
VDAPSEMDAMLERDRKKSVDDLVQRHWVTRGGCPFIVKIDSMKSTWFEPRILLFRGDPDRRARDSSHCQGIWICRLLND